MNYIGIDLHRDSFHAVVMNGRGKVNHSQKYPNVVGSVDSLLGKCDGSVSAVVEATRNWMWLVDALEKKSCDVCLAHPLKTKAIVSAKIKNDTIDATTLANLLRTDYIPRAYIATMDEQEMREISRTRIALVRQRTLLKNQVHAILAKQNIRCKVTKDLFSKAGRQWLTGEAELSPARRVAVDTYMSVLNCVEGQIVNLEKRISKEAVPVPEIGYLESIPGIGTITAFTLVAEIGDITRFSTAKQLASYMGMVPRLYHSGNTKHMGRITKLGNPYVRWILVQAAHRVIRGDVALSLFHSGVTGRSGKKKATVAVARKLLVLCHVLLTEKRIYKQKQPINNSKPKSG